MTDVGPSGGWGVESSKHRMRRLAGVALGAFALLSAMATPVLAKQPAGTATPGAGASGKITICHRTHSVTNPYRRITVNVSSVNGSSKNGHVSHTGAPFDGAITYAQTAKVWGDIIPSGPGVSGVNWSGRGQAIFNGTTHGGINYAGKCRSMTTQEFIDTETDSGVPPGDIDHDIDEQDADEDAGGTSTTSTTTPAPTVTTGTTAPAGSSSTVSTARPSGSTGPGSTGSTGGSSTGGTGSSGTGSTGGSGSGSTTPVTTAGSTGSTVRTGTSSGGATTPPSSSSSTSGASAPSTTPSSTSGAAPSTGSTTSPGGTTTNPSSSDPSSDPSNVTVISSTSTGSIAGTIWIDGNHNGVLDATEAPLPEVRIELAPLNTPTAVLGTAESDAAGAYQFAGVPPGSYVVTSDLASAGIAPSTAAPTGIAPTVSESSRPVSADVVVGAGSIRTDLPASGVGTIEGTIIGNSGSDGRERTNVACTWNGLDARPNTVDDVMFRAAPDASGAFTLQGVPTGSFSCTAQNPTTGTTLVIPVDVKLGNGPHPDARITLQRRKVDLAYTGIRAVKTMLMASVVFGLFGWLLCLVSRREREHHRELVGVGVRVAGSERRA